jgi:hypothetical protein
MPEDQDPRETQEWLESLDSVVEFDGADQAAFLLQQLHGEARRHAVPVATRRARRGRPGGGVPRRSRLGVHHRPDLLGQRRPVHVRPGASE